MNEQPEEGRLRESWSESVQYWLRRWEFMFRPPVSLTVLMALVVGFDFFFIDGSFGRTPSSMFYVSCCMTLAVLMAILASVAGGWRLYFVAVLVLLLDGGALAGSLSVNKMRAELIFLPLMIAAPILITLQCIKIFKGTFTSGPSAQQHFEEGLQFKIKHLLVATAVLAILIAILKAVAPYISFRGVEAYLTLSLVAGLLSVNALVSVWAVLGKALRMRLFVSVLVAVVLLAVCLAIMNYFYFQLRSFDLWFWSGFTALSWLVSTIQLYLFRRAGVRFVRRVR